ISLRDFLSSLRFDEACITELARRLGVDAGTVETDFAASETFRRLIADPLFRTSYQTIRLDQRRNLRAYLEQFGVDLTRHPLALVDIGWKGSIQDCLRKLVPPDTRVLGLYLGLIVVGQPLADKTGLLFSNIGHLSRDYLVYAENRSLYEILLCADH